MKQMMSVFALVAILGLSLTASAAKKDKKDKGDKSEGTEMTITGTAKCAKCSMHEADKCQAAVVTKDGDKEVTYYVTGKEGDALHKEICKADKDNVKVTGKVTEKDGKKMIAATKVE